MGPANLPDRAAARGEADEHRLVDLDVPEEIAAVRRRGATALMRDGGQPRALWLPTIDRAVAARRLESEREAHLPTVHGAVDRAHQTTTEDGSTAAWNHRCGDSCESVLEHGFYE